MAEQRDTSGEHTPEGSGGAGPQAPDTAPLLRAGQVIGGQFEVVRVLGRGGMGVVYESTNRLTSERVALKTILPFHLANPKAVQRFIEEIHAARRLRHPSIVAVFDVGQQAENPSASLFFTMEFLEGLSLRRLIQKRKQLGLEETVTILAPLCDALEYAHQFMVHRDLSPDNVMVLEDGAVKLLDFGLARMADRATMTATGAALGKAHYMSPEQRKSAAHVDQRTDIYALGVMLYEMLTGKLPHGFDRLADLRPDLPPEVDQLVGHCLASVEKRIDSAAAFRAALGKCLEAHRAPRAPAPARPAFQVQVEDVHIPPAPHAAMPARASEKAYEPAFVLDAAGIMESISAPADPGAKPKKRARGPLGLLRDAIEAISDNAGRWSKPLLLGTLALLIVAAVASLGLLLSSPEIRNAGRPDPDGERDEAKLAELENAVMQYYRQMGAYPNSLNSLAPGHLSSVPKTSLGMPFMYQRSTGAVSFPLVSGLRWTRWVVTDGDERLRGTYTFLPGDVLLFNSRMTGKQVEGEWSEDSNRVIFTLNLEGTSLASQTCTFQGTTFSTRMNGEAAIEEDGQAAPWSALRNGFVLVKGSSRADTSRTMASRSMTPDLPADYRPSALNPGTLEQDVQWVSQTGRRVALAILVVLISLAFFVKKFVT